MDVKMQVIQAQAEILDNLIYCEESISRLYALYARAFPEQSKFWKDLSETEKCHANSLAILHGQLAKGIIFRNIGRFNSAGIDTFVHQIDDAIDRIEKGSVSPLEGIKTALSIESSILEAHFYDIVQSDAEEYKSVAEKLSGDTHNHVKTVRSKFLEMQLEKSADTSTALVARYNEGK